MRARLDRSRIELIPEASGFWDWPEPERPSRTACKHGREDCDRCGTLGLSDALHRTRGGLGAVARLRAGRGWR